MKSWEEYPYYETKKLSLKSINKENVVLSSLKISLSVHKCHCFLLLL